MLCMLALPSRSPTSRVVEPDGSVKIYYGAGDSLQCVAESTVTGVAAALVRLVASLGRLH
jgi:hypothetical protein